MNGTIPLGPVMLDVAGTTLTADDRARLRHPLTGGVILFSRNFESCAQLAQLTAEIHALRNPPLIIAVDHEGGRVQRFREGFTRIPPVLELDYGNSSVIGDRAFHSRPEAIAELATAVMHGLREGGMAAVGKHFP